MRLRPRREATAQVSTSPAHPVLLINPTSGGGKAQHDDLVTRCRGRGIEPVVMKDDDDLVALAAGAVSSGADVVGMAGGDGSQAIVASIASGAEARCSSEFDMEPSPALRMAA